MKRYDSSQLKTARLIKGWTQAELAEKSGLNPIDVWRVENDKFHKPRTVKKIAEALGVDMEDLVGDTSTFQY